MSVSVSLEKKVSKPLWLLISPLTSSNILEGLSCGMEDFHIRDLRS